MDPVLQLKVSDCVEPSDEPEPDCLANRVLWALLAQPRTRTDLREYLRVRNETLGVVLARLEAAGRITRANGLLTVPRSRP